MIRTEIGALKGWFAFLFSAKAFLVSLLASL